jgi:D-xylose transport system substrate-binding protein
VLLKPVSITKDNVNVVIDDGFVKKSEICTGKVAAKCQEAGL